MAGLLGGLYSWLEEPGYTLVVATVIGLALDRHGRRGNSGELPATAKDTRVKVLILHNRYRQPGGEDQVVHAEETLLRERGAQVRLVEVDNGAPQGEGLLHTIAMAGAASWSPSSYSFVERICREFQPDVVHVHDFWMSLSPSVHAACRASGAATVQTLHNFRLDVRTRCCSETGARARTVWGARLGVASPDVAIAARWLPRPPSRA